jgi:heme/copper-type cytochrome/quinol oxidase subunit 4
MRKGSDESKIRYDKSKEKIDPKLITRLRIYLIVMFIILAVIAFEVLKGQFSIQWTLVGIIIGFLIGIIVSRMYNLSWDEETNTVIGEIDKIGAVILIVYLVWEITKSNFLGYWVEGSALFALILGITAGSMLARVLRNKRRIEQILEALEI